jgi:hypothetical protein
VELNLRLRVGSVLLVVPYWRIPIIEALLGHSALIAPDLRPIISDLNAAVQADILLYENICCSFACAIPVLSVCRCNTAVNGMEAGA